MKFGSYLMAQRRQEWAEYYLDYAALDEMIGALASIENAGLDVDVGKSGYGERVTSLSMVPNPPMAAKFRGQDINEGDFFTALEREMDKIDRFTHEKLSEIKAKIDALVERVANAASGVDHMSEEDRSAATAEAKELGDSFLHIEKFANLNYLGFHKILKKHDKQLPATPCKRFYITRLHQQRWIQQDYSQLFVNLSKVHSMLRGETGLRAKGLSVVNSGVASTTQLYWVRVENISKIKHFVLQHLPLEERDGAADSLLCSTVFFDNTQLELYHGRLEKAVQAPEIRVRWFDTEEPDQKVYIEKKVHVDGWNGDETTLRGISVQAYQVMPFIRGEYTVEHFARDLRTDGVSDEEIQAASATFEELHREIDAKQVEPKLRVVNKRVCFASPKEDSIRVVLNTGISMRLESPRDGPDCFQEGRWHRNPKKPLPASEITNFPHAVLEIRMRHEPGGEAPPPPAWVADLVSTGLLTHVHKFCKFMHGCAALLPEDVQTLPYWIDDETIQPSIVAPQALAKRAFAGDDEGELKTRNGASGKGGRDVAHGPASGMNIMANRSHSTIGEPLRAGKKPGKSNGYGTIPVHDEPGGAPRIPLLTAPFARPVSWFSILCCDMDSDQGKIPLKIEPKVFLANERTMLNWMEMAVTIATIAVGLLGFTSEWSQHTSGERYAHVVGMLLLPVAVVFCVYSLHTFHWRGKQIRYRESVLHDDRGPLLLGMVLEAALVTIFALNVFEGHAPKA